MRHLEDVLEDIKQIDCPVEKLKEHILDAYDGYEYKGISNIVIHRDEELDKIDSIAYSTHVDDKEAPKIVAMVKRGRDDYVATVIDAYISQ